MDALNIKGIQNSTKDVKTKIWIKKNKKNQLDVDS